jgi:ATP adenylyltransferase/5',5'''-P-1,P-4-tetraphosphate phosphorylase II
MVFVVLREKNSVEAEYCDENLMRPTVDVNTLGFAGTLAVKN